MVHLGAKIRICEPEPPLTALPDTTGYLWDTCDLLLLAALQISFKDSTRHMISFTNFPHAIP